MRYWPFQTPGVGSSNSGGGVFDSRLGNSAPGVGTAQVRDGISTTNIGPTQNFVASSAASAVRFDARVSAAHPKVRLTAAKVVKAEPNLDTEQVNLYWNALNVAGSELNMVVIRSNMELARLNMDWNPKLPSWNRRALDKKSEDFLFCRVEAVIDSLYRA